MRNLQKYMIPRTFSILGLGFLATLFLTCSCSNGNGGKDAASHNSLLLADAIEMLNSDESFERGLAIIDSLSDVGMEDAMYKKAYFYLWAPANDTLNQRYKEKMGIKTDLNGKPEADSINSMAVNMLQNVVKSSDSTHIEAMFYLGYYYWNGIGLKKDLQKAKELFKTVEKRAIANRNSRMFKKINTVLSELNEL